MLPPGLVMVFHHHLLPVMLLLWLPQDQVSTHLFTIAVPVELKATILLEPLLLKMPLKRQELMEREPQITSLQLLLPVQHHQLLPQLLQLQKKPRLQVLQPLLQLPPLPQLPQPPQLPKPSEK